MTVADQQTKRLRRRPLKAPPIPNYRLAELRKNRGWSRSRLGLEAGGISHITIGDIEEGRTRNPHARTLFLLAQALHTTVADLESRARESA